MDAARLRIWGMRALFAFIALVVLFFHLLPLDLTPSRWAGPDVLTALVLGWSVRRPDFVPALLIAGVMLLADLLLQRPPGLWSVLVLCAAEWLKSRERRHRETTFFLEWLTFAAVLIVITMIYRLVLMVLIVAPGTLALASVQVAMTILAYPLVVGMSYLLFGVRRAGPGEVDRLGRTI
ncbi:rod shape-determining protein MreD [Marivita sp. GX14005]|uniref:rod shape-determining protein MreD n=1 Tax=Marivita sp. GX14005 TaxID=2942276 RepID=UPI00201894DF|nr:rod shape-determining protein MreD [Marivita sp. GX14005]MCL3882114.1 rod shape-determining protein MreD [Marivita sp. GX14005]